MITRARDVSSIDFVSVLARKRFVLNSAPKTQKLPVRIGAAPDEAFEVIVQERDREDDDAHGREALIRSEHICKRDRR